MFAHETNFDIDNRIVCFDLYEMGEQLKPTALNVVLETIQNRVAAKPPGREIHMGLCG